MKTMNKSILGLVTALLSVSGFSDDIEIYSATVGDGDAGLIQPNILFIADTSGSMGGYVATEASLDSGGYDPAIDYDTTTNNEDLIYVYDELDSYTGVYITKDQNVCKTLNDTFDNAPDFPVYSGQAMQWTPFLTTVLVDDAVVCDEDSVDSSEDNFSGVVGTLYNGWKTIASYDDSQIVKGSTFELDVTPVNGYRARGSSFGLDGRVQVIQLDSSGNEVGPLSTTSCTVDTGRNSSDDCTYDTSSIPYTNFKIVVSLRSESRDVTRGNSTTSARNISHQTEVTYNINAPSTFTDGSGGTCTPSEATYADVDDGDWSANLQIGLTDEFILECAEDQGVHGRTDSSSNVYAALCGTSECADPYYTGSTGIDWTTSGADQKLFLDGNYHDYLNAPLETGSVRVWEATDHYFDVGENYAEDYNSPYTYFTWCDEPESDLVFREADGSYTPLANFRNEFFTDSTNDPGVIYQCQKKQEVMIEALTDMTSTLSNVNVGLMMFNTAASGDPDNGGSVLFAVRDIDDYMGGGTIANVSGDPTRPSVRASLLEEIADLPASGGTPLAETLYEAYLYYNGSSELNNHSSIDDEYDDGNDNSYDGNYAFVDRNFNNNDTYDSPISHSCQVNSVVYITDGEPTNDTNLDSSIEAKTGSCDGNCLDELAGYLYNNDINTQIDGENSVVTYTIGFDVDFELLADTAEAGGGEYFTANNYSELQSAFQDILIDIALSQPSLLVSPAVSVNAFNELQHRNDLYYATFKPRSTPRWEGNVKKYTITSDGTLQDASSPPIDAIDAESGFFSTFSQSYWSDTPDGAVVEQGGFREQLTSSRNVWVDGNALTSPQAGTVKLSANAELSLFALGASDESEAAELRDIMFGIDVDDENGDGDTTDTYRYVAESLHSRPFVLTYSGTSEADAHDILFVTTNQGFIHAVDARNAYGTELWAYVPTETLDNVKEYRDDPGSYAHVYGLDGEATVLVKAEEGSSSSDFNIETAYMFQGMRRGGRDYFAWDISNADLETSDVPISKKWTINGGSGEFIDLGQTWSDLKLTTIRYGCTNVATNDGCSEREVLIFSGGYDDGYYDDPLKPANDGAETTSVMGNIVYMVDAMTGALLWSTSPQASSDLDLPIYNSVPASPTPVDIDGDGDVDMMFFVDISGVIYRVDFDQEINIEDEADKYATGGVIADLSDPSEFRRFYNPIDVSYNAPRGDTAYLALSVGSGYRAHPKNEEAFANKLYVLIDENLEGPEMDDNGTVNNEDDDFPTYQYAKTYNTDDEITSRSILTESDLHEVSSSDPYNRGGGDGADADNDGDGDYGFYYTFSGSEYEKILQRSVTFNGQIIVASYVPLGDTTEAVCGTGQVGSSLIYQFDLASGELIATHEGPIGIAADASLALFGNSTSGDEHEFPEPVLCYGAICYNYEEDGLPKPYDQPLERTYWRENQEFEADDAGVILNP